MVTLFLAWLFWFVFCGQVATICKDKLHEIVKEEIVRGDENLEWKSAMEQSFAHMDKEVQSWSKSNQSLTCQCELQTPHCHVLGSTVVAAIIMPEKIFDCNCSDSRRTLP